MASTWIKGYKQASFRGVPFFIRAHTYSSGRRHAVHEFPDRDDVLFEDLGRSQRTFDLTAYIVDDNYFEARDNLIFALEDKSEPGILNHPYLGIFEVVCENFSESETTEEGRVARFNLTFKESRDIGLLQIYPNAAARARAAKKSLLEKILAWFENAYDIVSTPVRFLEDVNDTINEAFQVVDAAKKLANTQAEFKRSLENLQGKVIALSLNASLIASSFDDLINFGTDPGSSLLFNATADNADRQMRELYEIVDSTATPFVDTPTDISQDADYPAYQVQQVMKMTATGALVGLITQVPFGSQQDAEDAKIKLFDLIDEISETSFVTDDIYETLRDAKSAINDDLDERSINLPRLVDFELPETRNTLLITNEIYGNFDNEQDIIDRNKIIHPGFVSSGEPIQVKINE